LQPFSVIYQKAAARKGGDEALQALLPVFLETLPFAFHWYSVSGTLSAMSGTIGLRAGTVINQTGGALIAHALLAHAAGNVDLPSLMNNVAVMAGASDGGTFRYRNAGALTIGALGGFVGVSSNGQYIGIHAGGNLHLANGIDTRDNSGGKVFGGSRILAIDPGTGRVTTLYGAKTGESFYSDTMGEHQWLQNGNLLISESDKGHAFEVDRDGKVVWSYVNRWPNGSVGKISQATRYPDDYLSQSLKEPCDGK
jgi:hypothetical protein